MRITSLSPYKSRAQGITSRLFRSTSMIRAALLLIAFTAFASLAVVLPTQVAAHPFSFLSRFLPLGVDVHPHECDKCGRVHKSGGLCIERREVTECVIGKKEVFKSRVRCEYVSVAETRYYWKNVRLKKEIPCPYCKPVCKEEDCLHCFGREYWEKSSKLYWGKSSKRCGNSPCNGVDTCCEWPQVSLPGCCGKQGEKCEGNSCASCVEVHCKTIRPCQEKVPTKRCSHEKGETTITAHYWSCVKVPYMVYRQVKVPVCVKQPRYEKVKVPVTRYVCASCRGRGCSRCNGATGSCSVGSSATDSDSSSEEEIESPDDETSTDESESLPTPPEESVTKGASLLWGDDLRQE